MTISFFLLNLCLFCAKLFITIIIFIWILIDLSFALKLLEHTCALPQIRVLTLVQNFKLSFLEELAEVVKSTTCSSLCSAGSCLILSTLRCQNLTRLSFYMTTFLQSWDFWLLICKRYASLFKTNALLLPRGQLKCSLRFHIGKLIVKCTMNSV